VNKHVGKDKIPSVIYQISKGFRGSLVVAEYSEYVSVRKGIRVFSENARHFDRLCPEES
jgi:hypothetical protein